VAGRGLERLRAAGVVVDLAEPGPVVQAAAELNIGFFSRVIRRRPWLRLKVAASVDGRTALADGSSQWITGQEARRDGHAWRRRASAVLTGIGTVLADDPQLDVRLVPSHQQPLRVVLDSGFRTPPQARLFQTSGPVLVVGAQEQAERMAALRQAGAQLLLLPGAHGQIDLQALLERLTHEGVNELHAEAGAQLNGTLLQGDLVDEVLLYLAPKLLGPGRGLAALPALPALDRAQAWRFAPPQAVGPDLRLLMRREGADAFLPGQASTLPA
jgi:diaminohydroxyphosphoribosylaminopyrimidine deaminase / 5-amino-6-(5-phosphoribosylamino)uracil reductase